MSNPTKAQHFWQNEEGNDFLALVNKQTGVLGGIDGTGTPYGNLASAGLASVSTDSTLTGLGTAASVLGIAATAWSSVIDPKAYGAYFDVIFTVAGSTTLSSNIVSTAAGDPPFLPTDVGKIIFAGSGRGSSSWITSALCLAQSTITGYIDAHHVTVSNNATATHTGTALLAWGHDDTTAIQNAWNAAVLSGGKALQLPVGAAFISNGFTNPATPTIITDPNDTMSIARQGPVVLGFGASCSYLIPLPSYTTSRPVFTNLGLGMNFTIFGLGNCQTTISPSIIILQQVINGIFINVNIIGWLANNSTGATGFGMAGTVSYLINCQIDGGGTYGISCGQGYCYALACCSGDVLDNALTISSSGVFCDVDCCYYNVYGGLPVVQNTGLYHSDGMQIVNGTIGNGNTLVLTGAGGETHISGATKLQQQGTGTPCSVFHVQSGGKLFITDCTGVYTNTKATGLIVDSGGVAYASNSTFTGGVASIANSGTFYDQGGNTYVTAPTGLAPTAVFTSGGGSSPSCTLEAGSTNEKGTILLTTGSGSPGTTGTVTLTFAGIFAGAGNNTPILIVGIDNSGTAWGNQASVSVNTQSQTAPVIAWTNTASGVLTALATASAYRISYVAVAS